ncbi:MAG: hypothetical protein JXR05_15935 [Flavobacteriaceae bacterium]
MKNKNWIFLVFIGLLSLPNFAQEGNFNRAGTTGIGIELTSFDPMTFRNISMISNSVDGGSLESFYESVLGSPYVYDAMLPAKVNNFKDIVAARYDAYKDLITVQISKTKNFYLEKRLGNKIRFVKTNEEYRVFYGEKEKASFFKVVKTSEKFSLLVKQHIKLTGGQKPKSTYDEYKAPAFKRAKDKLYLSLDNENAVKAPTNKKKFYKLFSSNGKAVKAFVKKNKLDIKKQKDLLKIMSFYGSL